MKPLSTSPPKGRRQRSIRLYNTSDEKLQAWGVCQLVAGSPLKMRDGEPTWDVEVVTDEGLNTQDPWRFVFLLDRPIPSKGTGRGTQDWPVLTRATANSSSQGFVEVLVDGEVTTAPQVHTVSPKAGSQTLDGVGNVFTQLGPLGDPEKYSTETLRYVTPVRQNFPAPTTLGGTATGESYAGSAITARASSGYPLNAKSQTEWLRIVAAGIDEENPITIDFPGWYEVRFTARVRASADVAGIVSLGVRFTEGDTETDEYTEADHQPVIMPTTTGSIGSPTHAHTIDYDGENGEYSPEGEPLTINPDIWLGLTILHRFTSAGSFHFRNFGLIDVTLQEFRWTAHYRGPHYGA